MPCPSPRQILHYLKFFIGDLVKKTDCNHLTRHFQVRSRHQMKSILYTVCQTKAHIILTRLSTAIFIRKLMKLSGVISKWKFKFAIMKEL